MAFLPSLLWIYFVCEEVKSIDRWKDGLISGWIDGRTVA
jgi:hypothetical protein